MRYLAVLLLLVFGSCDEIIDVLRVDGPCTIQLTNGTTITTQESLEILQSTGAITYRDDQGKLWSIPANEYESYSCGN
jgi:hypothetical protein